MTRAVAISGMWGELSIERWAIEHYSILAAGLFQIDGDTTVVLLPKTDREGAVTSTMVWNGEDHEGSPRIPGLS